MTYPIDSSCASTILERFDGISVLVIGDLMLDEHVWGSVGRISPEAPVMVVDAQDFEARPGGAANVVVNIQALSANVRVVGVVGKDREGTFLCKALKSRGADVSGIVRLGHPYRTTRKIRIWASRRQQVVRVDSESKAAISEETFCGIREQLEQQIPLVDAVVLSDYNKGVVCEDVTRYAISIARKHGKVCVCNAKPANAHLFKDATAVTLNQSEAESVADVSLDTAESIESSAQEIISGIGSDYVVVTRGSRGLSVIHGDAAVNHISAVPTEVYDVAGAGDTVISVLTLGMAAGAGILESAALANLAGGAVVRKVGVATCTTGEIAAMLDGVSSR